MIRSIHRQYHTTLIINRYQTYSTTLQFQSKHNSQNTKIEWKTRKLKFETNSVNRFKALFINTRQLHTVTKRAQKYYISMLKKKTYVKKTIRTKHTQLCRISIRSHFHIDFSNMPKIPRVFPRLFSRLLLFSLSTTSDRTSLWLSHSVILL